MKRLRALADQSGAAATEMALLVPLSVLLLFGAFETGHFVWTQHKVVEAVRDGARFAGRLPIDYLCDGDTPSISADAEGEIKLLTRTGQLASSTALAKVPGWTDAQTVVNVDCNPDGHVNTGLYSARENGLNGPIVSVSANVPYPSFFQSLGIIDSTFTLSASQHAPVIGI